MYSNSEFFISAPMAVYLLKWSKYPLFSLRLNVSWEFVTRVGEGWLIADCENHLVESLHEVIKIHYVMISLIISLSLPDVISHLEKLFL